MRIAIWSESKWALARIHSDIARILQNVNKDYEFEFFDWGRIEHSQRFFQTYDTFDIIVGNTAILFSPVEMKFMHNLPMKYLARCLVILHCPVLNHGTFTEKILTNEYSIFTGVSPSCCLTLAETLNAPVPWTPFGVSTELFPKRDVPKQLRIAGFVGRTNLKGLNIFESICKRTNLEPRTLSGFDYAANSNIYNNIDILICCSPFEAGPLGNFEAAALGIPVLSTKVGNWSFVKTAKFFDTEDEAVDIITRWQANGTFVPYSSSLQQDVRNNWSNETLIPKTLGRIIDSFGHSIDLLDIGANYIGTSRSIHVDPIRFRNDHNGTLEQVAIIETAMEPVAYYTDDQEPVWIRGCISVGQPHPSLIAGKHTIKTVPVIQTTLDALVKKHKLRFIETVSIVVEGYDTIIAKALLQLILRRTVFVQTVKMLTNSLHSPDEILDIIELFTSNGFSVSTGNEITVFTAK